MSTTTGPGQYRDTRIDVKLVLSTLWIAMLIVFAYGDIFGLFRADVLRAALDGLAGHALAVVEGTAAGEEVGQRAAPNGPGGIGE